MDDYERARNLNAQLEAGNPDWEDAAILRNRMGVVKHWTLSHLVRLIGEQEPRYIMSTVEKPDDIETKYSATVFTDSHIYHVEGHGGIEPVTEIVSRASLERFFVESSSITTVASALKGTGRTQIKLDYPHLSLTLPNHSRSKTEDVALEALIPSLIADLDK